MFQEGGRAYIYLCYGIHHLFNVVTGPAETAHAVLIRAIEPLDGQDIMWARRRKSSTKNLSAQISLTTGPGALSQALGLSTVFTGQSLLSPETAIWIEDSDLDIDASDISAGPRIGVDYAGESAALPWRFWVKNSPFVKK
jgi:DNA-3-methyladenine glycosylase